MKNTVQNQQTIAAAQSSESLSITETVDIRPLSPSRRVELWSGRFAMVGFVTTVAAIAFSSNL
ncbi:MAG: hypothetical protein AAFQ89_01530 [Cyanobacteria bacterium J06626_18]